MCGIAGIACKPGFNQIGWLRSTVTQMIGRLKHRGPEDEGVFASDSVCLGHARLAILDLETGVQPMKSESGDLVIVFNGEIFNFVELRQDLEKQGYRFRTQSDTEVVLKLYECEGLSFVDRLNGQFAIAIWDDRHSRLILVRDRVGICPMFFSQEDCGLVFASEIKALVPALDSPLKLSAKGLDQVFTFWSTVSPQTIFQGVNEVEPGTMLIHEKGNVKKIRYWDWRTEGQEPTSESEVEVAERVRELLTKSVEIRLRADVPVGAYLSGGLDSSILTALMAESSSSRITSFSIGFDESAFDETAFQRELIDALDLRHQSIKVSEKDLADDFVGTIWHTECPILRNAPVPMGRLSRLVKDNNLKVVLTGEGADEVFGGYDIFKEAKIRKFWSIQPKSAIRPLLLKKLYPYLNLPKSGSAHFLAKFFGNGLEQTEDLFFSHLPRWESTAQAKRFFSAEVISEIEVSALETLAMQIPPWVLGIDYFSRAQYLEAKLLMPGYLLSSQGDRMLMRNSVEGRFPYLDHNLIEYSNRIPPKLKMKVLNEKYILKKACNDLIPNSIIKRHKQPYRAPDLVMHNAHNPSGVLRDLLTSEQIKRAGLFDEKKVAMLLKKVDRGAQITIAESQSLTGILSTQILNKLYCEQGAAN